MNTLDWKTRTKFTQATQRAQDLGADQAEYLFRYGLLVCPSWTARMKAETALEIGLLVSRVGLAQLIGQKYVAGSWTPADIIQGIITLITEYELEQREQI